MDWTEPCDIEALLATPLGINWSMRAALAHCPVSAVSGDGDGHVPHTPPPYAAADASASDASASDASASDASAFSAFSLEQMYTHKERLLSTNLGPGYYIYIYIERERERERERDI